MTRNLKDLIKKSFVFTLVAIFTLSGLDFGWTQTPANLSPVQHFSIPDSLGKITDSFIPASGRQAPLLIHIEDAHAHFATQSKIREILNYLRAQHGVNTVFIEGASGNMDAELFDIFPDSKLNVKAAERWMKEGQFSGAEVFGIENSSSVKLSGVEDKNLYSANLKEFRETHKIFEANEPILSEWNFRLKQLKTKIYLGDLKKWDESAGQFASEKINILEYSHVLKNLSEKRQISIQKFPHLKRLIDLEEASKSLSNSQWQKEWSLVRDFISNQIPSSDSVKPMLLKNWNLLGNCEFVVRDKNLLLAKDPRLYFEILVTAGERYGFSFESLKELPKAARFLISQKEIAGTELFSEISDLELALGAKLVETRRERELYDLDHAFRHLNRLFHLAVDRSEWNQIRENQKLWSPSALYPRIQKLENEIFRNPKNLNSIDDSLLSHALNFYRLAYSREDALVQNSLNQMTASNVSKAVLITGGFHSEGIRAKLKKADLGYLSVRPSVMESGEESRYLEIMLGKRKIMPPLPTIQTLAVPARLVLGQSDLGAMILRSLSDSSGEVSESSLFRSNPRQFIDGVHARLQKLADKGVFNFIPARSRDRVINTALESAGARSLGENAEESIGEPLDRVAVWGTQDDGIVTTAALLKHEKEGSLFLPPSFKVTWYDYDDRLKSARQRNHEPERLGIVNQGFSENKITNQSFDKIHAWLKSDSIPAWLKNDSILDNMEVLKEIISREKIQSVKDMKPGQEQEKAWRDLAIFAAQFLALRENQVIIVDAGLFLSASMQNYNEYVTQRSRSFAQALASLRAWERKHNIEHKQKTFMIRSFLPPGKTREIMQTIYDGSGQDSHFTVIYAPNMLRKGRQMSDIEKQQVVLGMPEIEKIVSDGNPQKISDLKKAQQSAVKTLKKLLVPQNLPEKMVTVTDDRTAELSIIFLYAILGTKLGTSFSISQAAHLWGADMGLIADGMGKDKRIRDSHLSANFGAGGPLLRFFQLAYDEYLKRSAQNGKGSRPSTFYFSGVADVIKTFSAQREFFEYLIEDTLAKKFNRKIRDGKFALLGVAYKGGTGSVLASPSLELVKWLLEERVGKIYIYDPYAKEEFEKWVERMKKDSTIDEDLRAQFSSAFYEFVDPKLPQDPNNEAELNRLKLEAISETMAQGTAATIIAADLPEVHGLLTPIDIARAIKSRPVFDGCGVFGHQVDGSERISLREVYDAGVNYVSIGRRPVGPNLGEPQKKLQSQQLSVTPRKLKIAIIGTGYVGLTTAGLLSSDFMGHTVTTLDIDAEKIKKLNQPKCELPIYEPGLDELVKKNRDEGRLFFTASPLDATKFSRSPAAKVIREADVVILAVGTPQSDSGDADLSAIFGATRNIGTVLKKAKKKRSSERRNVPLYPKVIVVKSTVPPKTFDVHGISEFMSDHLRNNLSMRKILNEMGLDSGIDFALASNPEFLKEGTARKDVEFPDRTVIGSDEEIALSILDEMYAPLLEHHPHPMIHADLVSAPIIKYGSNVWLSICISLANEFAQLAEELGASYPVMRRIASNDERVGEKAFLAAGIGWGGSCFPKDTRAALKIVENAIRSAVERLAKSGKRTWEQINTGAQESGMSFFPIAQKNIEINDRAPRFAVEKIKRVLGDATGRLDGKQIAILGLAFKPETDDVRETRSMVILKELLDLGASVTLYDPLPKASGNFIKDLASEIRADQPSVSKKKGAVKKPAGELSPIQVVHSEYGDRVQLKVSLEEAVKNSHALVLATDWDEIKSIDLTRAYGLMQKNIVAHTEEGKVIEAPLVMDGRGMLLSRHSKEALKKSGLMIMFIGEEDIIPSVDLPPSVEGASLGTDGEDPEDMRRGFKEQDPLGPHGDKLMKGMIKSAVDAILFQVDGQIPDFELYLKIKQNSDFTAVIFTYRQMIVWVGAAKKILTTSFAEMDPNQAAAYIDKITKRRDAELKILLEATRQKLVLSADLLSRELIRDVNFKETTPETVQDDIRWDLRLRKMIPQQEEEIKQEEPANKKPRESSKMIRIREEKRLLEAIKKPITIESFHRKLVRREGFAEVKLNVVYHDLYYTDELKTLAESKIFRKPTVKERVAGLTQLLDQAEGKISIEELWRRLAQGEKFKKTDLSTVKKDVKKFFTLENHDNLDLSVGSSLGFFVSDPARKLVAEWVNAQMIDAGRQFVNADFSAPMEDISPSVLRTAKRIIANTSAYLPGELVVPIETQSDESLLKVLEPIALQLRGESKKDVSIFATSALKKKIETMLKSLKVDETTIYDYVHFKSSHESLELYLIGRTAKFGNGRVVLIGDSETLTNVSVPGVRKISRDQVRSDRATQDIQQKDRLVAQIAAIDLGYDLLSASEWIPQPDKLLQDGGMLYMKEDFFTQYAEKWVAQMRAQLAIFIAA